MTTHGAEAVYTCHFGYDLKGDDFKRTCVQGTWNGTKPTCSPIPNVACYVESFQYKGIRNSTINGILCQRWDSQNPHKHFRNNVSTFPEETLQEAENYCRDPDGEGTPWCYTIDPNKRWDICEVEKC
ncbi:hepatocyte growth factor-like [Ruditapes philippinarum]|uniref:hepatocyte growth factor-like n=1 Tax=Ruditapes philippinarum TaxID=129788 RepID=UPI00295B5913|nr:hepatocyte growth factor-like [Ruditapes philippinarum]